MIKPTHRISSDVGALYFTRIPCAGGFSCHYDPEVLAKGTLVYEVVDSDYEEAPGIWVDTVDGRYLLASSRADYLEPIESISFEEEWDATAKLVRQSLARSKVAS